MFVFLLKLYLSSQLGRALWCTPPQATLGVNESLLITEQAELLTIFSSLLLCASWAPAVDAASFLQNSSLPRSLHLLSFLHSSPSSSTAGADTLSIVWFFLRSTAGLHGFLPWEPPWLLLGKSPALKFFKLLLTPPFAPPPPQTS